MKILMLNNEFPPLGGGTGTVNRELLKRWTRASNLEIDLITSALGHEYQTEQFAERVRLHFVPVNNKNLHHSSNRELATYAARALPYALKLQRAQKYDFVFAWSAVPAGAVALVLKKIAGLNYLVRVCGPDIPGFEERYGALYPILTPMIRATWHNAAHVVAKCGDEANLIRRVDARVAVTIVPNGVDLDAFTPAHIPDAGALRLLCVARLIERKGQEHLIQAVKRLTEQDIDVVLDLVGTGDARRANEQQARDLGIADRVNFVGYVPREEIAQVYANAHVFVLASYNEGMSVATLEAMAAGLPLVVTRTPGTKELVQENVNGLLFDWADVDALTAHLKFLAMHRDIARAMGHASRELAQQFAWEDVAARYGELFWEMGVDATVRQRIGREASGA
ncbi:MAG: glycosyl transferase family 1 [Chloroflexi bacterium UTCFX4]|jgi:glycosyltransferase involved in cell wall biosynthesis|nr:MAG: glycosyl transferase family 1 [Chloroflexi bacterium UTCFX4]